MNDAEIFNAVEREWKRRTMNVGSSGVTDSNTSALIAFHSIEKGVRFPRMTTTQRNAIVNPVAGLVIYNTTTGKLNVYTTAWEAVTSA